MITFYPEVFNLPFYFDPAKRSFLVGSDIVTRRRQAIRPNRKKLGGYLLPGFKIPAK